MQIGELFMFNKRLSNQAQQMQQIIKEKDAQVKTLEQQLNTVLSTTTTTEDAQNVDNGEKE